MSGFWLIICKIVLASWLGGSLGGIFGGLGGIPRSLGGVLHSLGGTLGGLGITLGSLGATLDIFFRTSYHCIFRIPIKINTESDL